MPLLSFLFRCVAHSLSLSLSSCLRCLALLVVWLSSLRSRFRRMVFCPSRIICGCQLCVFVFTVVSWFSLLSVPFWPRRPLQATFTSAYFCLLPCFCCFSPAVFASGLFWFGPVYLVITVGIRSGSVNNVR